MASAVPGTRHGRESHRRGHRREGKDTAGRRRYTARRDGQMRLRRKNEPVLCRTAGGQDRGRHGR